jgi:uncharacterized protein YdeI (YjbR/CyaY-like superfamily)
MGKYDMDCLVLSYTNRKEFRQWLIENHNSTKECWVTVKKGEPSLDEYLFYIDAVEEALCFGWIDSTNKTYNGRTIQRFSPRKKNSPWSELNIERCKRLEKLQLMTESGRNALPETLKMGDLVIDPDILDTFRKSPVAWEKFQRFPELYRRIRIDTIQRDKRKDIELFWRRVKRLVQKSEQGEMFGDWNDYGRLLNY